MSYKNQKTYTLKLTDYIDKVFKVIPSNAFINKGRCGVGGTQLELNTHRNTIFIVPNRGIIEDKKAETDENGELKYPDLFAVYGGVTPEDITNHMLSDVPDKKIMTTPDSLYKIIKAAGKNTDELYSDYFLLLDECHTIITEAYREAMIKAFEQCFSFKNRAYISATPFYFTDPRMKNLDYYRIKFDKPLGKIHIINVRSVIRCVNETLINANNAKGNIHIFYNSVTEIAEAIERAGIEDCNVFCADREENKDKIGQFFKPQPTNGQYKKINFYTTSSFEGWSLREINPIIILVTDVHRPHTRVGISNKGVQAIGRQRVEYDKPETLPEIYHITNHRNTKTFKPMEKIKEDYIFDGEWEIDDYNDYKEACKKQDKEPSMEKRELVEKYADIIPETGEAKINHTKISQFINESACNEEFNHIDYIKEAWERAGYEAEVYPYKETISRDAKRKTARSVKDILSDFEALEPKNTCIFFRNEEHKQQLKQLKAKHPILYKAYQILTTNEIEATGYNAKKIEKLVILKNNKDTEIKVLKLLPLHFSVGGRYTNEDIKNTLQKIYDEAGYEKTAAASQIRSLGWYDAKTCKIPKNNGGYDNGFEIERMAFKLLVSTK